MVQDNGGPRHRRPGFWTRLGAVGLMALAFVLIAVFALPYLKRAFNVDSCLDAGGRWNHEHTRCEGARR